MGLDITVNVGGSADEGLAAAAQVEVIECIGRPTSFRLRYPVDIQSGDLPFLVKEEVNPGTELTILEAVGTETACLVKGVVRGQSIHLVHGGAGSWAEVVGSDTSIKLDRESKTKVFDGTDLDAMTDVLKNYYKNLDIQSTDAGHFEDKHTLVQHETDYHFVQRRAQVNGFLFWITYDDRGTETAHVRRPQLDGSPEAILLLNVENANLESVDIHYDVERPTSVVGSQLDLNSKESLDGSVTASPQTALGSLNLAAIAGNSRKIHLHAPADDAGDLQARGQGLLIESDWFVRATCRTSKNALGKLVRAHTLVELNGVGTRHSGKYFVSAVRHTIDGAAHLMDLTLLRNAWSA